MVQSLIQTFFSQQVQYRTRLQIRAGFAIDYRLGDSGVWLENETRPVPIVPRLDETL